MLGSAQKGCGCTGWLSPQYSHVGSLALSRCVPELQNRAPYMRVHTGFPLLLHEPKDGGFVPAPQFSYLGLLWSHTWSVAV